MRAGTIIVDKDRVLVMKRYRPERGTYYTLIGGGVEDGETVEAAAIREAKEETNLDVELGRSFTIENPYDGREHAYFIVTRWSGDMRIIGEEADKQSPEDSYELVWVPVEELRELSVKPEAAIEPLLEAVGERA